MNSTLLHCLFEFRSHKINYLKDITKYLSYKYVFTADKNSCRQQLITGIFTMTSYFC